MKTPFALLLAAGVLALAAVPAGAAGVAYPDADWTQAMITEPDGTQLHADVLRPKGFGLDASHKTPVVISIGPYFNHSGQTSAAGPVENTPYDPVGPSAGPSERFQDFVEGSGLLKKGYTFVMVDLRGFGGSTGCLDWGGPGEQSDVAQAIKWAATQPWSTGAVGTYGKSYDAMTGLIATALHPDGLKAVVAQEPVYDDYRYLYGDGIRRENWAATPALYDAIEATPGPLADTPTNPTYNVTGSEENVQRPGCLAGNWADQAGNDDHYSPYWRARNLITLEKDSTVPLLMTQGTTENNTAPDGVDQFLRARSSSAFTRGWLGPWEHVRGNETCGDPSTETSTGCSARNVGQLKEGRPGWFDEVMRFYDRFLKGAKPAADPPFAIQTNDGVWRPELKWPPADATGYSSDLNSGSYADTAQSTSTGTGTNATSGVWTISPPLTHDVHISGAGTAVVDVSAQAPDANLVVDVYDLDATGRGPRIARQGHLIRNNGPVTLHLMATDWKIPAGHRIGVRVTDNNSDWWIAAIPTEQTVTVYGGRITLPFLHYLRTQTLAGQPGVQLASYRNTTVTVPAATLTSATRKDFRVPPALQPEPLAMKTALDKFQGH